MRLRCYPLALGLVALLLMPATAHARMTLDMPDGPAKTLYQSWVDGARVPTPDVRVKVHLRNCDENAMTCMVWALGGPQLYYPDLSYLWIEPSRSRYDQDRMHALFLHELGHIFDYYISRRSNLRARFMRMMHLHGGWWSWRYEDVPPGEIFADAYAYAAMNVWPDQSPYEGYRGYRPSHGRHQRVARLIRGLG